MSATISVRKAVPADLDTLFQLYIENGGGKIGQKRDLLWNGLRKLTSSPELGFHILAEAEGRVVGMLRICFEWSPYRDGTFWWVENVYVRTGLAEEGRVQRHAQVYPQRSGRRPRDLRHQALHRRGQSRGATDV